MSSSSSASSVSSSSSMLLNVSLSNPFSIPTSQLSPPSPTSSTTSSSTDSHLSINKKVYQLEKELESIKIKKICFGVVSVKELDLFLQKVAAVKNELKNSSVFY